MLIIHQNKNKRMLERENLRVDISSNWSFWLQQRNSFNIFELSWQIPKRLRCKPEKVSACSRYLLVPCFKASWIFFTEDLLICWTEPRLLFRRSHRCHGVCNFKVSDGMLWLTVNKNVLVSLKLLHLSTRVLQQKDHFHGMYTLQHL